MSESLKTKTIKTQIQKEGRTTTHNYQLPCVTKKSAFSTITLRPYCKRGKNQQNVKSDKIKKMQKVRKVTKSEK